MLNVHASLLPKYRGSSPIQWSIINGDEESGISVMRTVKAVDAGDVLLEKATPIGKKETAGELFDRLAILGGEAIVEAIGLLESGKATFTPQDESKVSHCSMISKEDGNVDFAKTAHQIDCFVRGMTPWPSAYTHVFGKTLKIFDVEKPIASAISADTTADKWLKRTQKRDFSSKFPTALSDLKKFNSKAQNACATLRFAWKKR